MRRSPFLSAATAALALTACGNASNGSTAAAAAQDLSVAPTPAPATPPAPIAPAPAGSLAAQMQAETQALQSSLPIQVDRVTQVTAVHVEGTEAVYTLRYAFPVTDLARARAEAQAHAQTSVCANAPAAALIRRGATMRYDYTDSIGIRFNTRVTSCP